MPVEAVSLSGHTLPDDHNGMAALFWAYNFYRIIVAIDHLTQHAGVPCVNREHQSATL